MKEWKFLPLYVLMLALILPGCAYRSNPNYYHLIKEVDKAIKEAQLAGADKYCPEEFQEVLRIRQIADDAQHTCCKTTEAMELAKIAIKKANGLCQPVFKSDRAGVSGNGDSSGKVLQIPKGKGEGPPHGVSSPIILTGVNFTPHSMDLHEEFTPVLKSAAEVLKKDPTLRVRLAGYAISSISKENAQRLSEQRAKVVKEFFVSRYEISPDRLETVGFGEKESAEAQDLEILAKDGRVELIIISDKVH